MIRKRKFLEYKTNSIDENRIFEMENTPDRINSELDIDEEKMPNMKT